jgi:hypothetical protein
MLNRQVPGFTHPVTDLYLEDILGTLGYPGASNPGASSGTRAPAPRRLAPVPAAKQAAIHEAIMQAFLRGDDAGFDALMDVRTSLHLHNFCLGHVVKDSKDACLFVLVTYPEGSEGCMSFRLAYMS